MIVRSERGVALLLELWTLAFLALLATRLVTIEHNEVDVVRNLRRNIVQECDADGAIYTAAWHLLDRADQHWSPDGSIHRLRMPGGMVDVRITDEANKVNLNTASIDVLRALLRSVGVTKQAASELAQAIIDWREVDEAESPSLQAARYRAAGLGYAPPAKPFRNVDELLWVAGMTPQLYDGIKPHVTIYSAYGPDGTTSDPVVRLTLLTVSTEGGVLPLRHADDGVSVVDITASARGSDGAAFTRHAVLRREAGATNQRFDTVTWDAAPWTEGR
jgi:general secretion pathway protein K